MDVKQLFIRALEGDLIARTEYNEAARHADNRVNVKANMGQYCPQLMSVDYIGPRLVRGVCGLVFPHREYVTYNSILKETIL